LPSFELLKYLELGSQPDTAVGGTTARAKPARKLIGSTRSVQLELEQFVHFRQVVFTHSE
jgi:hypothetical protein